MAFNPMFGGPPGKKLEKPQMTHVDEGSKGGSRSVLMFSVVAAFLTVTLILIGVTGRNVPNTVQSNAQPTTSGSQNP
jgi:hypothetical protein